MEFGFFVFAIAVIPVIMFIYSLRRVRSCLEHRRSRLLAFVEMPLIIALSPLFVTCSMLIEAQLDPEFIGRSFTADTVSRTDILLFSYDQALRGALFDFVEVFKVELSPIEHECNSILFCVSMFLFRTANGIAASSLIFASFLSARAALAKPSGARNAEGDGTARHDPS
ncbi:MAG: hypothetical protein AAGJ32_03955 [Pseudomonadota bacterium]